MRIRRHFVVVLSCPASYRIRTSAEQHQQQQQKQSSRSPRDDCTTGILVVYSTRSHHCRVSISYFSAFHCLVCVSCNPSLCIFSLLSYPYCFPLQWSRAMKSRSAFWETRFSISMTALAFWNKCYKVALSTFIRIRV